MSLNEALRILTASDWSNHSRANDLSLDDALRMLAEPKEEKPDKKQFEELEIVRELEEEPRQHVEDRLQRLPGCFRVVESKAKILDALRGFSSPSPESEVTSVNYPNRK